MQAQQEQLVAKEKIDTVKRMYLESVNNENVSPLLPLYCVGLLELV